MSRKLDAAVAELLGYDVYWQKPFDELEPYIMVDGVKLTKTVIIGERSTTYKLDGKISVDYYSKDLNTMPELVSEIRKEGWNVRLYKNRWWHCVLHKDKKEVIRTISDYGWPDALARAFYKLRTGKEWTSHDD